MSPLGAWVVFGHPSRYPSRYPARFRVCVFQGFWECFLGRVPDERARWVRTKDDGTGRSVACLSIRSDAFAGTTQFFKLGNPVTKLLIEGLYCGHVLFG